MKNRRCNRRTVLIGLTAGVVTAASHARLLADVGRPMFYPAKYGARGIGASFDDGPAIQAAIDAAWINGGGTVLFSSVPAFYNVNNPIICRPGVSLKGDGSRPRIISTAEGKSLLLPGNFHPNFIDRAKYDMLKPVRAGDHLVKLENENSAKRYKTGSQVYVTSRAWGKTGNFGLPHYGWLNYIVGIKNNSLILREAIDISTDAQITPLNEIIARNDINLFFYSDATISGLVLESGRHIMNDSAMLRVDIFDNEFVARTAIYGNAFQYVRWTNNQFTFSHAIGEQSLNSLETLSRNNKFIFSPKSDDKEIFQGFYFQEFGRNLAVENSVINLGHHRSRNFLISIANSQNVKIDSLTFIGDYADSLIYMGNKGSEDFHITGNSIQNCNFNIGEVIRFMTIKGQDSSFMHGNFVENCVFTGKSGARDAIHLEGLRGTFSFSNNKLENVSCINFPDSPNLAISNNRTIKNSKVILEHRRCFQ
ncbi:hypothetical protein [Novosphingobium sp. P6W]|uniref:hypothetical protein n=1 Tax=Novosphingobium sp. P6W TaxID=1609758 RepID=UPI000A99B24F|nr:hypothetical protein [Novosphingobium sp. P6W]